MYHELSTMYGWVRWYLFDDAQEQVIADGEGPNRVTAYGHRMYLERGAGVPGAASAPTGMRLGHSTAPATYTGAGAALGDYLPGSARAFSLPVASSMPGNFRRLVYTTVWPSSGSTWNINEAVLTNENPLTDIPGIDATTVSRIRFENTIVKRPGQGLSILWTHDLE